MIPKTYNEWENCIVNDCGIELTDSFIQQRLDVLNNESHHETKRLLSLYGKPHLEKLIRWFTTAAEKLNTENEQTTLNQIH
ncbi:TPA: hypothetical protein N2R65_004541 [Klebsiella variicola]|uniref:hypothetical protein n=1 Tax=Klebsiella variicola TaxID=244366 RepID=UPI0007CCA287|nr:hypothetical protein [Klebsiella variicola]PXJ81706.1 hypothetical protein DMR30_23285 [Klebsiella variicola]SBK83213.1 Uncharacterised protein [Klebsiella variicola]HCL6959826.1 hypothetical protein [Klebsiella variicola]